MLSVHSSLPSCLGRVHAFNSRNDVKIDGEELVRFEKWLKENGATILSPTNPYELLRFQAPNQTIGIVYANSRGKLTFIGSATLGWKSYQNMTPWEDKVPRPKRLFPQERRTLRKVLSERDKPICIVCGQDLNFCQDAEVSIEHFLDQDQGGSHSPANCALVHRQCNSDMSKIKSVAEKINYILWRRGCIL